MPEARVTGRFGRTEGIGAIPGARERERGSYLPRPGSVQVVRISSRVKALCETVRRAIAIAPCILVLGFSVGNALEPLGLSGRNLVS